jgi:virginiamycin B lyase
VEASIREHSRLCLLSEFKLNDPAVRGVGTWSQSKRRQRPLTLWLLPMLSALTAIGGCANISSLPRMPSVDRLIKPSIPHTAPQTIRPSGPPAQLKALTPFAIAAGPDGNLWFSELRTSAIGRITPAAEISTFELGNGALADRLTAGPDDAMWFTDPAGNRIGRLGLDGTTAYVPLPTPESGPAGIVNASDGNLWFTEHAADRVARVTPLGTVTEFVLPHRGGPAGIAEGGDRNLYIAENSGNRIDQISMDGRIKEFRLPTTEARPDSVVRGANGDIWFTEFAGEKVGRLTMAGRLKEYALTAKGPPVGITAGSDGNVWVTIPAAHAICRLAPDGTQLAYYLPSNIMPAMIAAGSDGNLWFTQPNGMLGRFSPSGIVDEFPAVLTAKAASRAEPARLLISAP